MLHHLAGSVIHSTSKIKSLPQTVQQQEQQTHPGHNWDNSLAVCSIAASTDYGRIVTSATAGTKDADRLIRRRVRATSRDKTALVGSAVNCASAEKAAIGEQIHRFTHTGTRGGSG